jgi:tRNA-Thr(GGU) m(6)t(6)A37 methyltransferase TsaA
MSIESHTPFSLQPIGILNTPFTDRFGIPRQAGIVTAARGALRLLPPFDNPDTVRGLGGFSHVWLISLFHGNPQKSWKPTVRPPRLGGNRRVGVFASRSPYRPNPLGLSLVELVAVQKDETGLLIVVKGVDLLDGTPILDIKPYVPYADSASDACGGFAQAAPAPDALEVDFTPRAEAQCRRLEQAGRPELSRLIAQMIAADPRPAYRTDREETKIYAMSVYHLNVQWTVSNGTAQILNLEPR